MEEDNKKRPVGRPSEYYPELCEKVIPLLKQGMGIEEIGLELDIGYRTLYEYMDRYPEFAQAINKGRDFSHGWWMKKGRKNLKSKKFNAVLWYMNMKNRFGWKDKQETSTDEGTKSLMQSVIDKL